MHQGGDAGIGFSPQTHCSVVSICAQCCASVMASLPNALKRPRRLLFWVEHCGCFDKQNTIQVALRGSFNPSLIAEVANTGTSPVM